MEKSAGWFRKYRRELFLSIFSILFAFPSTVYLHAQPCKVLIVVEGNSDLKNLAMGDGRQLATLMGHFNTITTVKGVKDYLPGEIERYDVTFYIGFSAVHSVPSYFLEDVLSTKKLVCWINTGFIDFCKKYPVRKKFGFSVTSIDSTSIFDGVKAGEFLFSKSEPITARIDILDRKKVTIVATAVSSRLNRTTPYIVKSGNLIYIADSPFSSVTANDRYLFFADYLHEILKQPHEESHSALIRIEDVTPLDNPDRLRNIADILSDRNIPFLIAVVPFYVDPAAGIRVSLSDKPDIVDALKYMVKNGGTIVMHGVTHQYRGTTTVDYEFWDDLSNAPIKGETTQSISRKIEMGIEEFFNNGLIPLVWETPHYTASFKLYATIPKYFSSACEQRLSIENSDYGQYFPYVIHRDLFGQRIYPENLGYVPVDSNIEVSRKYVRDIMKAAKTNLTVRDGFASVFFHSFLDPSLLIELVDGIQKLGYTFINVRDYNNWVKTSNQIAFSGSQEYSLPLNDQYLLETYFAHNGEIKERITSEQRLKGIIKKSITLEPGEFYKAEPTEFHERPMSLFDNLVVKTKNIYEAFISGEKEWSEIKPVILWNHYAKGAAYNDQASFASALRSLNIPIDTIFVGQPLKFEKYNLLIVPYTFIDSLDHKDYSVITNFVLSGGNLITDAKNDLAEELGIHFTNTRLKVSRIKDRLFPEEKIIWRYPELVTKFELIDGDEVFCVDEGSGTPIVIGRQIGHGKLIFLGTRFDSYSQHGYSQYPYLLEYIRKYFRLNPIVLCKNLDVFFDPGFRHNVSTEQLVKQWVNAGIRSIHVAGWHKYPKYTYDYERLIRLAHANGMLVYLWLEPPHVNQKFWLEHPEWREKNYRMEDARPSWRYPVALTDKRCVNAMIQEYKILLDSLDWDGVNLAELYFECGKGFDDPKNFTPMHPTAQEEVQRKFGIKLNAIFDPKSEFYWKGNPNIKRTIILYRIQKLQEVYEALLSSFTEYAKKKPGFSIVVTAVDSYFAPEMRELIAVDMDSILLLQRKYSFTLQVEDPEKFWSTSPFRYLDIAKHYKPLISDSTQLAIDINIGPFRKKDMLTPFPTFTQTGIESYWLVAAASIGAPRVTIYSESSVNPQDLHFFAYALATHVKYNKLGDNSYKFESPYSFTLKLPPNIEEIKVDGIPTPPFRENEYIIPMGNHVVDFSQQAISAFSARELQARLMSITANLESIWYSMHEVTFVYNSKERVIAAFNRPPSAVWIDDNPYNYSVIKGNDCYSILLPHGHHTAKVKVGNKLEYGVSFTSLWSSTIIAVFGIGAVLLLTLMYVTLKIIRRRITMQI